MAVVRTKKPLQAIRGALALAKQITQFPSSKLWLDYDAEADVLYISFRRPQKASETVEEEDGLLLRYRGKDLVGITILDASKR